MSTFQMIWFGAGACLAPFSYALTFAHFQRKFPTIASQYYGRDRLFALLVGLSTVVAPLVVLVPLLASSGGKYGLKFH